jgi:SAM-dependent methyltransferase
VSAGELDALLSEQLEYYRARAPEYFETAFPELGDEAVGRASEELARAVDALAPTGDVLELACGPGTWTGRLLRHARSLTALDGSPEMLALARERVRDDAVRFIEADIFRWRPERRYDGVFFGFWLSHVPIERFERFWTLVAECLRPGGRALFVDDAYRTPEELLGGEDSAVIRRRLTDGTPFRAVKVPHTPRELERRLDELGWRIRVTRGSCEPFFFWGAGTRPLPAVRV